MDKLIYKKYFQRSCPLVTIELWYYGEKSDQRQYTEESQPASPYLIFERTQGIEICYLDERGPRWVKDQLLCKLGKDRNFASKTAESFRKKIAPIHKILEREAALSKTELGDFAEKVRDTWPWFEAVWWFIDALDEKGQKDSNEMKLLQEARKYGELFTNCCSVIRKSIEANYPGYKKYTDVILLQEAVSGKIPSQDALEKRLEHYFYTDDTLFVDETKEAIEQKYNISIESSDRAQAIVEFTGRSAFPGKAIGKIRKIIDRSQNAFFERGEILLSPTTQPDFLPSMEKAAAIISDEGGLISHAAILARELRKPCIIGTKTAFDTLKDGDLVEVDAEKGIVRKISSQK